MSNVGAAAEAPSPTAFLATVAMLGGYLVFPGLNADSASLFFILATLAALMGLSYRHSMQQWKQSMKNV